MRARQWLALGSLLGALALILVGAGPALSQRAPTQQQQQRPPADEDLPARLMRTTKLAEADIVKVLNALGPAIRDELNKGKTVSLPGLGSFRVVQVGGHRDLVNGKPVAVPATNTIEFLATGEATSAANAPLAQPNEVVPAFRYVTIPGQTPGLKTAGQKTPSTRVR
jgi:nucleoid DNA-binding protein